MAGKGPEPAGLTTRQQAALLYHAGHMAWMQDDLELAMQREEESVSLWQSAGRRGAARRGLRAAHPGNGALQRCALLRRRCGACHRDLSGEPGADARGGQRVGRCLRQGMDRTLPPRSGGDNPGNHRWRTGKCRCAPAIGGCLGRWNGDRHLGKFEPAGGRLWLRAREYAEQAQGLRAQVGHRHSLAVGWDLLGDIAVVENNPDDAAAAYHEAIVLLENLGNRSYADELAR